MTISNNFNWQNSLPGVGNGPTYIAPQYNINAGPASSAITINDPAGEALLTFHKDGIIETQHGKIHIEDWITIIQLMKQFIFDIGQDPELSNRYPYLKDAAHSMMMRDLKK